MMLMDTLDHSFSSGSPVGGGLSISSFPSSPESQLVLPPQYNECEQPQYSSIQYADDDHFQYGDHITVESQSPLSRSRQQTPSDESSSQSPYHSRTPLSSISSYSSESSSPGLLSSQSSISSEVPSMSNMSISSDASSSSLFSESTGAISNPFSCNVNKSNSNNSSPTKTTRVSQEGVPRRRSAPARGPAVGLLNTSTTTEKKPRKDSFVYDVQLDNDKVLLFVPDLDLVKSHLMFAVREEVDVLKEQIGDLMERITHLEYENTLLKQYATPETLQQLQHHGGANP